MASIFSWIRDQASGLYRRLKNGKTDRTVRDSQLDTHVDRYQEQSSQSELDDLMQDYANGMRLSEWESKFRSKLKEQYIAQYVAARGGREAMTQSDWGQLGAMLKQQYGFLGKFVQDIGSGAMSDEGRPRLKAIRARAMMYFNSAGQAYERGKTNALGTPRLPAYPGDGSTQCLSNCGCHWSIEEVDEAWLASWVLGATEHCPDCVRRAQEWNPYTIDKPRVG